MTKVLDCRGLACPQPAVQPKKAIAEAETVTTIVDNDTAKMNVSRMGSKEGYAVEVEERDDGIYLHISKGWCRRRSLQRRSQRGPWPHCSTYRKRWHGTRR